jgi:hypothetical protein
VLHPSLGRREYYYAAYYAISAHALQFDDRAVCSPSSGGSGSLSLA